jgi:hypothetical protein
VEACQSLPKDPLCQSSCRLNRVGTFEGADIKKRLDTERNVSTPMRHPGLEFKLCFSAMAG